jgi:hypothetical protein
MQYPLCRHIKTNGGRCHAPSLSGGVWCYFHNRLYVSHSRYCHNKSPRLIPGLDLELNALEDSESVQVALSLVINALATGHLEARRATALLYGLQLASRNAARLPVDPNPPDIVRSFSLTPESFELAHPQATLELAGPDGEQEMQENQKEEESDEEERRELTQTETEKSSIRANL